jgi:hypothetical protein
MTTLPASKPADGNLKALWVATIADTQNPTSAEMLAGTVVDLSCYLTGLTPAVDQAEVTDDRLCSRETFTQPGRKKNTLEAMYIYRAQEPLSATNKAQSTLIEGTAGYIVARWGMSYETAMAATQIVDVWPVTCGVQNKAPGDANSILVINQRFFVTNQVIRDAVVAA